MHLLGQDGWDVPEVVLDMPLIRLQRVGDMLNREWLIFPDGRVLTCESIALFPDILDIATLSHPEPSDLIKDQERILDLLAHEPQRTDKPQ